MDALSVVAAARGRTCSMRRVCLFHLLACTPFPKHTLYGSCCRCSFLHMHPCCNIRLSHSIPILTNCSLNVILVFHPRKSYSDSCVLRSQQIFSQNHLQANPRKQTPETHTHTHSCFLPMFVLQDCESYCPDMDSTSFFSCEDFRHSVVFKSTWSFNNDFALK